MQRLRPRRCSHVVSRRYTLRHNPLPAPLQLCNLPVSDGALCSAFFYRSAAPLFTATVHRDRLTPTLLARLCRGTLPCMLPVGPPVPPPFFCRVQSGLLNDGKHSCVACLLLSAAKQGKSRERKKAACACAPFYARCKPVGYRGSARKGPPPSVRGVYFAVSPVPPQVLLLFMYKSHFCARSGKRNNIVAVF